MSLTCIYLYKNKLYVPTALSIKGGGSVIDAPIYSYDFSYESIITILNHGGYEIIKNLTLTADFWKNRKDPLLIAMKLKSWNKLAQVSPSYTVAYGDTTILYTAKLDTKGRYTNDEDKQQSFNITDIDLLAQTLWNDIHTFVQEHPQRP